MSTTKSKNNMAGAWMNKKKENEKLKSQIVVLESNQNGVRLKMNETGFYENITINPDNIFRWPILVSESVITSNVIEDNDEALIMAEMEKEWKAMEAKMSERLKEAKAKIMRKDIIEPLRAEAIRKRAEADLLIKEAEIAEAKVGAIINGAIYETITKDETDKNAVVRVVVGGNAHNHNPEKNYGKKERQIVKRKHLSEVITRLTQFKTTIKGQVKTATTEDGWKINGDGTEYDTLNKWLDASVRAITGDNKTKKSVFEVVLYYNDERNEWRKLGDDYTADTTKLN